MPPSNGFRNLAMAMLLVREFLRTNAATALFLFVLAHGAVFYVINTPVKNQIVEGKIAQFMQPSARNLNDTTFDLVVSLIDRSVAHVTVKSMDQQLHELGETVRLRRWSYRISGYSYELVK
jgi:hypothetical protein